MTASRFGVAISTVRVDETVSLVMSLLDEAVVPGCIAVVHQGGVKDYEKLAGALADIAAVRGYAGLATLHDSRTGLSRGRNLAVGLLSDGVEWVWTPNDTSRPSPDFVATASDFLEGVDTVGAVAVNYRVAGEVRRDVSGEPILDGWALWKAIEPAIVWNVQAVHDAGGFDETIGTGSPGWAQSGEGTDLLSRIRTAGYRVATFDAYVEGRNHHQDPRKSFQFRKEFYYSVGFGCVARRHFSLMRTFVAVATPLIRFILGSRYEGARPAVHIVAAAVSGRAIGLVLGDFSPRIRKRGQHWR
ncbi:MAG: hypothetical protein LLG14_13295 [Nocardiaceae bacterium]|nr:hypothetical protein [Nocardiaceae bacterium]